MKKSILFVLVFYLGALFSMPKTELWFTIEKALAQKKIYISEKKLQEQFIELDMQQAMLYYKTANVGEVKHINFFPFIVYNTATAQDILIRDALVNHDDLHIKKLTVHHSIFNISTFYLKGNGDFGTIEGDIDLDAKKLRLFLYPLKDTEIDNITIWRFKQTGKGLAYESDF